LVNVDKLAVLQIRFFASLQYFYRHKKLLHPLQE